MTRNFRLEMGLSCGDFSGFAVEYDCDSVGSMFDTLLLMEQSVSFSEWPLSNRLELK
jgi:hypothetical protein